MYRLGVIGVGNMAKAIIGGIVKSDITIERITLFDKNSVQYEDLTSLPFSFYYAETVNDIVENSDIILLSVKPQNYADVLCEIASLPCAEKKIYISIAAGIKAEEVSNMLNGAAVIRVLPNLPMVIGNGVSLICKNDFVDAKIFRYVSSLFESSGSVMIIDESDMNRLIGVTSSSPAYVFKFINAIYNGGLTQGLSSDGLIDAICDVVIGSAMLLKSSQASPDELVSKVASKGGTTEKAIQKLDELGFNEAILQAMIACTARADELGENK